MQWSQYVLSGLPTRSIREIPCTFCAFHFRGILTGMIVGYLIMGSYWLVLTNHYNRKVIKTLERLEETRWDSKKAFQKLDLLDAEIQWRTLSTTLRTE